MRAKLAFLARYGIFVVLAFELLLFAVTERGITPAGRPAVFLSLENQLSVLHQNANVIVLAVGMTFVILTAGIDLSVGSLVALTGVAAAQVVVPDWGPVGVRLFAGIGAAIALGALCGVFNGLTITRLRIPPFVATLAMMMIAKGAVLLYTGSQTISGLPAEFGALGRDTIGVGGNAIWIHIGVMLAVVVVAAIALKRTRLGRYVFAVGGNAEAARLCGIPVARVLLIVYAISGALAGLGGVLTATKLNTGDPKLGGLMELDAIAAVVVGGTSLMGGRGSIWGTLAGALVIAELNNFLALSGVQYFVRNIIVGAALIAAAYLDRFRVEQ